jgi:prepilin-type processing-associated H-X9-DG protein
MKHNKGITQTDAVVAILIIIAVIVTVIAILPAIRKPRYRLVCGTNLKGMANALNVYAFDYHDKFPVPGAGTHAWDSTTTDWDNPTKDWTDPDGTVTIAASLYLLVREADVGPKSFICRQDKKTKLKIRETPFVNGTSYDMTELWDFGPNPKDHLSYSYQFPYGKHPATGTSDPNNAIMADRNPWCDSLLTASDIKKEKQSTFIDRIALIDFASTTIWHQQIGNSAAHDRIGQNVLFGDGHVSFEKRPDVATNDDNIYTIGGDTEPQRRTGTAPTSKIIDAANPEDSLLMNDR